MSDEWTTRRAPHMERYVTIRPTAIRDGWYVFLKVGGQEFVIAPCWDTEEEARHCRDMLCIALEVVAADEREKLSALTKAIQDEERREAAHADSQFGVGA